MWQRPREPARTTRRKLLFDFGHLDVVVVGRRGPPRHGAGPHASRAIVLRDAPRHGLCTSQQSHSGRRATCVGASMNREHATLRSRGPQNYLILQGCFSYRGYSHGLSPTGGVRRSGTKRSAALYQEWLVRFGFWIYGDLGGGGPARGVRLRMEKQRDFGGVAPNQLLGCSASAANGRRLPCLFFSTSTCLPSGRGQHRASVRRVHGLPSTRAISSPP